MINKILSDVAKAGFMVRIEFNGSRVVVSLERGPDYFEGEASTFKQALLLAWNLYYGGLI